MAVQTRYIIVGLDELIERTELSVGDFAKLAKVSNKTLAKLISYKTAVTYGVAERCIHLLRDKLGKSEVPDDIVREVNTARSINKLIGSHSQIRTRAASQLSRQSNREKYGDYDYDNEVYVSSGGGTPVIPSSVVLKAIKEEAEKDESKDDDDIFKDLEPKPIPDNT